MPINADIPLQAGRGVNPLNVGSAMQTGLGLANNAIANQKLRAARSAGQDWQASIQNGVFNPQDFQSRLSQDQNAGFVAPQYSQEALHAMQQELTNRGLALEQAHQRATYVGDIMGGQLAQLQKGQNLSLNNIKDAALTAMRSGMADPKQTAAFISSFAGLSPQEITAKARDIYSMAQHTANAAGQQLAVMSNGAGNIIYNTNPVAAGGAGNQIGFAPNRLSPAAASTPVTFNYQGRPITETRAQIAANQNQLVIPGNATRTPINGNPLRQQIAEGLSPAQQSAQSSYGAANAAQANAVNTAASQVPMSRSLLESINAEASSANPGPLAEQMAKLGGALTQLGIKGLSQATAYQLTQKETMQYVMQASQGMGVPTDGKMLGAELSTPNAHMTPDAIHAATGYLLGAQDYMQSKAEAMQAYIQKYGPDSTAQFQSLWNRKVPTASVFQMQYLDKAQQAKYWKSLSKSQKEQYVGAYNFLESRGLLGK